MNDSCDYKMRCLELAVSMAPDIDKAIEAAKKMSEFVLEGFKPTHGSAFASLSDGALVGTATSSKGN